MLLWLGLLLQLFLSVYAFSVKVHTYLNGFFLLFYPFLLLKHFCYLSLLLDKTGYAKQKVKACLEAQNEDNTELDKEKTFPITTPTNDHPGSLLISFPSQEEGNSTSPEEGTSMAPEENEETGLTVNGNVLTQEGGKETILSQPETNETIVTF